MGIFFRSGPAALAAVLLLALPAACDLEADFETETDAETETETESEFDVSDVESTTAALTETRRYEAEARTRESGCGVASNHAGFTGAGFMDYGGNGTWIEWNDVSVAVAGEAELSFRYANAGGALRRAVVEVNGQAVGTVPFGTTGAWNRWQTERITAPLRAGRNTIRVRASSDAGGPNLDNLEVTSQTSDTLFEAEDHTAAAGCQQQADHAGFTGSGFMDYGGNGTWIEWNRIRVASGGTYTLQFRYANGSGGDRRSQVQLNGRVVGTVAFPPTGGWPRWGVQSIRVVLRPGFNTVRVTASTSAGGPNLDHVAVTPEPGGDPDPDPDPDPEPPGCDDSWPDNERDDRSLLQTGSMVGHVGPTGGSATHEAHIWALAGQGKSVSVTVQESGDCPGPDRTVSANPRAARSYTSLARITGLAPNTNYRYLVRVNGRRADSGSFRTPPRPGQPARFSYLLASCMDHKDPDQPVWNAVLQQPRAFQILHGDNVYSNTYTRRRIVQAHTEMRNIGRFPDVLRTAATWATWDDHDFGPNDSWGLGTSDANRRASLEAFKDVWANPSYGAGGTPGTFHKFSYGDVDFFMLDNRYHRGAPRGDTPQLGREQTDWLIRELRDSRATFKIIVQGSVYNIWQNSHRSEYQRVASAIANDRITGVVFHAGDAHRIEVRSVNASPFQGLGYTPIEVLSSGIGRNARRPWAMIDIDTTANPPRLSVRFFEYERQLAPGDAKYNGLRSFTLDDLSP